MADQPQELVDEWNKLVQEWTDAEEALGRADQQIEANTHQFGQPIEYITDLSLFDEHEAALERRRKASEAMKGFLEKHHGGGG
ncbi:MAG: hypothetical protein J4G01_07440 [Dehalococcoidia bacterium]|nr:hypothetical protein [Dehalococcoidia bacterium]